jgi:hypothetical protein
MPTIINGTDNTAATPALTGTDTDTGVFFPAANTMALSTGGTEQVRVTSAGDVGIGTNSPTAILHTVKTSSGAATVGAFLQNASNTTSTETRLAFASNTNTISDNRYGWIGYVNTGGTNGGAFTFATTPGGEPATERMRINSSGNLLVGTTTARGGITVDAFVNHTTGATFSGAGGNAAWVTGFTSQSIATGVQTPYSVQAGGIYSVSDARLKENVVSIPSALNFIDNITPVEFDWKEDKTKDTGYIAQDLLAKGYGHLVSSISDSNMSELKHEDGNVSPAGIRFVAKYDSVVPILHRAIQELKATVDAQAARITALESAKA